MEKLHIIADSNCDIPPEDARRFGIEILGVDITYAGKTRREFYDIDPDLYWHALETLDEIPVTTQITPTRYLESFLKAKSAGCTHVIVTTISSTASGSYNSAVVAKGLFCDEHGDAMRIEIVDSRGYSMIYGRGILRAAELRDAGAPFRDILAALTDECARAEALFLVYSLKHLKKSGRITGAAAFVGEALGLRPILRCIDGVITIVHKARGDKNVGVAMVDELNRYIENPAEQVMQVMYTDVDEAEIDRIEGLIREHFNPREIRRLPLGPAVSTNTGPHAIAVIYLGKKREAASS